LIQSGVDFYDISILNGYNVPVEFSPVQPFAVDPNKPYDCGNPGGRVPLTGSGSCSWEFNPPKPEFKWVQEGNENTVSSCSSDAACSSLPGTVCGMSINAVMTCGELLGYWTLDQFCGQNLNDKYPAINCDLALPSPNFSAVWMSPVVIKLLLVRTVVVVLIGKMSYLMSLLSPRNVFIPIPTG
jgi:hypothetical protein